MIFKPFLVMFLSVWLTAINLRADDYPCKDLCDKLMGQIRYDSEGSNSFCSGIKNTLPRSQSTHESFKKLRFRMTWEQVCQIVGAPECTCGSGIVREVYKLRDGYIGTIQMDAGLSSWALKSPNGEIVYGDPEGKLETFKQPTQSK